MCRSYRSIKLLGQPMKVLERVLEKWIRCQVSIDNMQFGFMPGKGTPDAIFMLWLCIHVTDQFSRFERTRGRKPVELNSGLSG